jgi:hypothetical protein
MSAIQLHLDPPDVRSEAMPTRTFPPTPSEVPLENVVELASTRPNVEGVVSRRQGHMLDGSNRNAGALEENGIKGGIK